jgi:phosphate transport system substrate-binding protein
MLMQTIVVLGIVLPQLLPAQTVHGTGSTFPSPLLSEFFKRYRTVNASAKLHYTPAGAAKGVEELIGGKADFAATEAPPTDEQMKRAREKLGGDVLQVPMVLDAVVPIYNVDGVNVELKFTSAALAGIYLGTITKWDDPAIAKVNPGVLLPDEKIMVVHRSDDSDTTYLWTDFLSKVSPTWASGPGRGLNVKWPVGVGAIGDDGEEDLVLGTRNDYLIDNVIRGISNSIGYVELHYAIQRRLPYGDVQNASGAFTRAANSSIMAEAASAANSIPDAFRSSLTNVPSQIGYPISSFTWILVPANMRDKGKAKTMADFMKWMLKEGQETAEALHYVRLPSSIVDRALVEVAKLQ